MIPRAKRAFATHEGLRVAYCLPVLKSEDSDDTSFRQQICIAKGLRTRGHRLNFVAPADLYDVVCTPDLQEHTLVARTWSDTAWFRLARKVAWRTQRLLGVPYLNVFSNYCLFDACLRCLPGHDIVHERNGLYRAGVAMACKRLRIPYLLFFDADDILEHDFAGETLSGALRWRAKQVIRLSLTTADGIVCVSSVTKNRLVTVWDIPAEKITVLPNGVDVNEFRPYPESRAAVRASLGIGEEPMIIFVGTFLAWHDVMSLLDAFALLLNARPHAHLVLVGDGKLHRSMVQHTTDLGIRHSVHFTGMRSHSEVPHLVSAADIAVAPYPKMAGDQLGISPMKLFEYMASGTAIIASDFAQMAEILQDGVNGLLTTPGDAEALAVALKTLIDDPVLRSRLGRQARQDAVQDYSWERYISRLELVYQAVIHRKPLSRPDCHEVYSPVGQASSVDT